MEDLDDIRDNDYDCNHNYINQLETMIMTVIIIISINLRRCHGDAKVFATHTHVSEVFFQHSGGLVGEEAVHGRVWILA